MELFDILSDDSVRAAPRLLGCRLVSEIEGRRAVVEIAEVEAYREDDPASHSFAGPTRRNRTMFGRGGLLYVYRSYGVHWCANVVTGPEGKGAAVLLRGGVPIEGEELMRARRGRDDHLVDGPGKLCQALGITGEHDGVDLLAGGPLRLEPGPPPRRVVVTPRVGISKAKEKPWRFVAVHDG